MYDLFWFRSHSNKNKRGTKISYSFHIVWASLLQFVGKLHAWRGLKEVKQMHENEPGRVQECELTIMHKGKKGVRRWEGGGDGAESCCPCAAECTCTQNRCFPPHLHALWLGAATLALLRLRITYPPSVQPRLWVKWWLISRQRATGWR